MIAVAFDASAQPDYGCDIVTKLQLGYTRKLHPSKRLDIARRETPRAFLPVGMTFQHC